MTTRRPSIGLFEMFQNIKKCDKDIRITVNLYTMQEAAFRLPDKSLTDWISVLRKQRPGCGMSPDFFNLHSEIILRDLDEIPECLRVNRVRINNIRSADDTTSEEGSLQIILSAMASGDRRGLNINCQKTKVMCVSKQQPEPNFELMIGAEIVEQVSIFNYLGAHITANGDSKK